MDCAKAFTYTVKEDSWITKSLIVGGHIRRQYAQKQPGIEKTI